MRRSLTELANEKKYGFWKKNHTQLVRIYGLAGEEGKKVKRRVLKSTAQEKLEIQVCVGCVFARKPKKAKNDVGTVLKCVEGGRKG